MKRREFLTRTAHAAAGMAAVRPLIGNAAQPDNAASADAPKSKIRIGQIGTRHAHASGKMASLRRLSDHYEVVGVVEPDPDLRRAAQKQRVYEGLKWMTEEELLNTPGLKAVAVETQVSELLATAARVIAAGKHVHLDKPAGESLPEFRQIRTEAEEQGLVVQMGYMFRYNPAFQLCYRTVEEGWLGRVFSIETVIGKVIPAAARKPLLEYEGGTMFELGCHVIDSVVFLLGKPDRVHPYKRSSSRLQDGLADNQLAVLEYPNALVTVRSSLVEVEGFERRRFVVCGDQGTCDIRPLEPPHVRLALQEPREDYQTGYQDVDVPDYRRYDGDFIDLAQVIRNEKEFAWSAAHDLAVQETILQASGLPLDNVP